MVLVVSMRGATEFVETERIKRRPGKLMLVTIAMGHDPGRPVQHRTTVVASTVP